MADSRSVATRVHRSLLSVPSIRIVSCMDSKHFARLTPRVQRQNIFLLNEINSHEIVPISLIYLLCSEIITERQF